MLSGVLSLRALFVVSSEARVGCCLLFITSACESNAGRLVHASPMQGGLGADIQTIGWNSTRNGISDTPSLPNCAV